MPEEVRKEAFRELDRLAKMPPAAAEYTVARTYLDWLIAMPWQTETTDNIDIGLETLANKGFMMITEADLNSQE